MSSLESVVDSEPIVVRVDSKASKNSVSVWVDWLVEGCEVPDSVLAVVKVRVDSNALVKSSLVPLDCAKTGENRRTCRP